MARCASAPTKCASPTDPVSFHPPPLCPPCCPTLDSEAHEVARVELERLSGQIAAAEKQCEAAAQALEQKKEREKEVGHNMSVSPLFCWELGL